MNFKSWHNIEEGYCGYITAHIFSVINEGRRDMSVLQNRKEKTAPTLFDEPLEKIVQPTKKLVDPTGCPLTPLSGYRKHISAIQSYARQSPDNFAQVLIFSPLSANVSFAKHWDNFQVLMLILKHYFPQKVEKEKLEMVIDAFNDYLHNLAMTINGFKLDTITYVWNQREALMSELNALAEEGDDDKLIARLSQIPGVQPVKGGFIAQLLYGRAGCIDTHNIDIYSKVFPKMKSQFDPKNWDESPEGIKNYTKLLGNLQKKGIGTEQLWDVWVDFVEAMYKTITSHGKGYYADMGSSLDPNDPVYQALKNVKIPKTGIGKNKKDAHIPLVSGQHGMGASATHLQMDPDDALAQFHKIYRMGQQGSDAAHAVPFHLDRFGRPLDTTSGLGVEPTSLHYFGKTLTPDGVDPDHVRSLIDKRLERGGKKAMRARHAAAQGSLFQGEHFATWLNKANRNHDF